ncbi:MAG: hypothetical protein PHW25_05835 [Zoogloea sp.]|uniref:hypothetical protein n=1 Tax=Zoogloea sp. TaxID=49181 RepID=UPI0026135628|nr:hypothetical protein [Zoogloea sp.]MDD3326592.1 hypothetical protein [Zoogloea sp.]
MSLFQTFLANTDQQRETLSNACDLWDCIPRYAVSRARMNSMRTPEGFLEVLEVPFHYRQRQLTALIYPARVRGADGRRVSYYPSAREELIEHALRKLATEQQAGFFDRPDYRSGVRFSLYRLRRELEQQGHSLRYDELVEGLDILSLSAIEIVAKGADGEEGFARATYLTALAGVNRTDYEADREARWLAQFHPLVTRSIDEVTYRQFNYQRLMNCDAQLARWLLCQLVIKYTQASMIDGFDMRFSTIKRDSALLNGYGRVRDAVAALDEAWEELKSLGALHSIDKKEHRGGRNKIEDVTYTIKAARDFSAEQKAANRRRNDAQRDVVQPPSTGGSSVGWQRAGNVVANALHLSRPQVE